MKTMNDNIDIFTGVQAGDNISLDLVAYNVRLCASQKANPIEGLAENIEYTVNQKKEGVPLYDVIYLSIVAGIQYADERHTVWTDNVLHPQHKGKSTEDCNA